VGVCVGVWVCVLGCVFSVDLRLVFLCGEARFFFFYIKNLGLKTGVDSISVSLFLMPAVS